MSLHVDDTIAGLATAPGRSEAAIVRLSGVYAFGFLKEVFVPDEAESGSGSPFSSINGNMHLFPDLPPVPCRVFAMKAPRSYTREDVVEFHIPGSPVLVEMVLSFCRLKGIRMPEPGEFTRRAFQNGRISLTNAMGVMEVISASSKDQLAAARNLMFGGIAQCLEEIECALTELISLAELAIDFTDQQENVFSSNEQFREKTDSVISLIRDTGSKKMVHHTVSGEAHVIIGGMVNAGKSTLFNSLLGYRRSSVSSAAGTTRDVLRGKAVIQGKPFVLYDTAGLSSAPGLFERKARQITGDSGYDGMFMLLCISPEMDIPGSILSLLLENPGPEHTIAVGTKSDVCPDNPYLGSAELDSCFSRIMVSQSDTDALEKIKTELVRMADSHMPGDRFYVSGILEQALGKCGTILDHVRNMDILGSPETAAEELREALSAISCFSSGRAADDVLDMIFSRFCIGK